MYSNTRSVLQAYIVGLEILQSFKVSGLEFLGVYIF